MRCSEQNPEISRASELEAPTLVLSLLWILPKSPGQNGLALGWHLSESDGLDWFVRRPDDFQEDLGLRRWLDMAKS